MQQHPETGTDGTHQREVEHGAPVRFARSRKLRDMDVDDACRQSGHQANAAGDQFICVQAGFQQQRDAEKAERDGDDEYGTRSFAQHEWCECRHEQRRGVVEGDGGRQWQLADGVKEHDQRNETQYGARQLLAEDRRLQLQLVAPRQNEDEDQPEEGAVEDQLRTAELLATDLHQRAHDGEKERRHQHPQAAGFMDA